MTDRLLFLFFLIGYSFSSYSSQETAFTFSGETIPLRGEWNLVMGSFLTYEEVKSNKTSIPIDVPGTWNNAVWEGEDAGAFGFGTYYTTVILNDISGNEHLALQIPEISLAYRLFINDKEIGNIGSPGKNKEKEIPKIDFGIFDFEKLRSDTITIIFHISNFSHESGGLWYAPNLGYEKEIVQAYDLNKTIKLLILGSIIIGGLFQLYIFARRRKEKFGLYFFLVCVSLILLTVSRGDMPLLDIFPSTSWEILKKTVYISIFLIAPANALFLRELYPDYYNRIFVNGAAILSFIFIAFTLFVSPRVSYALVPPHHIYNLLFGVYLFVSLVRAARANKFGARFLLIGYIFGFIAAVHDTLSSQYIIEGLPLEMIHIGTLIYIFQLIFVLAGRYIYALESKEKMSDNLKKINDELEDKVKERTQELSKQNEIIELQNGRLQQAMEEKDDLMAVVAHDLKAPFDSIYSLSEILKPNLSGEMTEFIQMIKKMTLNGKGLIENLTHIGQYEQDDFQISPEHVDLNEMFQEKTTAFQKTASEKEVVLTSSIFAKNQTFFTDQAILGRIIDNLLSNAIKFSPSNKEVHFELNEKESLEMLIKDHGPGFSEKDKKLVFGKFQTLSAKPTNGESSTGLGLSIVKNLVDVLNGEIELVSEQGKGASFKVTIPKSPSDQ